MKKNNVYKYAWKPLLYSIIEKNDKKYRFIKERVRINHNDLLLPIKKLELPIECDQRTDLQLYLHLKTNRFVAIDPCFLISYEK